MEGITESRSFSFLGGEGLDGFQVEVEIQMKIVQVFTMNEEHQHVETLSAKIETDLHPVHLGVLEKFSASKSFHKTSLFVGCWFFLVKLVLYPLFEHFLVADSCLDGIASWTPFLPPARDQRYVVGSSCLATSLAEGSWSP